MLNADKRLKAGWNTQPRVCAELRDAGEPLFDGTYTEEKDAFFCNYLCSVPKRGAVYETGFEMQVLYDIFCRWIHLLLDDGDRCLVSFAYLYIAFLFMHLYPTYHTMERILMTPLLGSISEGVFRRHVRPRILKLGLHIKETVRGDLYLDANIIDGDASNTASIDGSPIILWKPQSIRIASMLVAPKYGKKAVVKFQIVVTNMFRIADEWGLDIGVDHDTNMCHKSGVLLWKQQWEKWFADLGYEGLRILG